MDINPRKGLKGLIAWRNKWGSSKEVPMSQVSVNLPPPPPPPPPLPVTTIGLLLCPGLKKKRKSARGGEGRGGSSKGGNTAQKCQR